MTEVKDIIKEIEEKGNNIAAKLELMTMSEAEEETIKQELIKTKQKLENEEITKFTYATMLEANKQKELHIRNNKKKTWDELAEIINEISDKLNEIKEIYNQKSEVDGTPEIVEKKENNK
jgi:Zn-dependent oligopeptidase